MAGPPTAAFLQATVVFSGTVLDYGAVCTHGFSGPFTDLDDLAGILVDFHVQLLTPEVSVARVDFKQGPEATGPSTSTPVGAAGTVGGFPGLASSSILVTKIGQNISGRRWGRIYSPNAPSAWVAADGDIGGPGRAAIVAACQDLNDNLGTSPWAPVIFNGSTDPTPVVIYAQTQTKAATQRRRLRR